MPMSSGSSMRTSTIGRSPEMPCAHSAAGPPSCCAPGRPAGAAATDPSRGRGWPGSGTGAPRRARCRGGAAAPAPASRPASPRGRTSPDRDTCRRDRGPRRATARRASKTRRARVSPARQRAPGAAGSRSDRAPRRSCWTAAGRRSPPPASGCRARGRGTARGRSRTAAPPTASPSTDHHVGHPDRRLVGATAAGGWPAARRARATNSVCTNRLENAGWAASAAGGASTISAYEVSSISRVCVAEIRERDAADLGVVLRRDHHLERGGDGAVAPDESRPGPRRT